MAESQYERVPADPSTRTSEYRFAVYSSADLLHGSNYSKSSRRWNFILSTIIGMLASLLIYHAIFFPNMPAALPTGMEFGACGDSVAAARAIGCRFDPMSWHWVPEPCYSSDKELSDSFLLRSNFRFYKNYTLEPEDEIEMKEILNGDHELVYTPDRYHPIHCTFIWMKVHKAWVEKRPIDNVAMSLAHSQHCQVNTLNPYLGELGKGNCTSSGLCATSLRVAFNTCGYY